MKPLLLLVLGAVVSEVFSRSAGPPVSSFRNQICNQMLPNHGGTGARSGNGGYTITTNIPRSVSSGYSYTAGQTYTVTLSGTNTFRGFLVIAHVPGQNNMLLGAFTPQANQQTLNCDNVGTATTATITHSNSARMNFQSMTFTWQAPSGSSGIVDFRYTVVRIYSEFYVLQSAASNDPLPQPTTSPPTTQVPPPGQTTTAAVDTTTAQTNPPDTQPLPQTTVPEDSTTTPPSSGGATAPVRAPGDYRLTFRKPPGCAPSECDVFIGIDTNAGDASYLDIYLEGQADGWVAVGFSGTPSMSLADVVACNRNPATNMVEGLDAWNIQGYGNNVDAVQDVQQFSGTYSGGRIRCSVAKRIAPLVSGTNQDLDLNNNFYVLYGRRMAASVAGALVPHEMGPINNPTISSIVNPADLSSSTTDADSATTISGLIAPVSAPGDYRLILRNPPDCAPSECDVFVGIDTNSGNSDFLDIYLEGQADGWVAVGFSATSSMSLADVVACNRNPATNMVEALDAWNVQRYSNNIDAVQDVQLFSGSYSGGRIRCSVAKRIAPPASGADQDLDLNNDYYVLYGQRMAASVAGALIPHEMGPTNNPSISSVTVNPVTAGGSVGAQTFPKLQLLRLHGILMIVAWPLLALCGIFFASWMRPALPNGEWFQVHRAFLLASMFVGAAGFTVAFIANYPSSGLITLGSNNRVGTAHFAIGITVMLLHILNPVIAAFRCKPTGKSRWIFNLLHGTTIGVLAELAALANVSMGTYLLFRDYTPLFWVFIAYLGLYFIIFITLLLLFTLSSCLSSDPNRKNLAPSVIKPLISSPELSKESVRMSHLDPNSSKNKEKEKIDESPEEKPKKTPSKDSPIRWASFVIYIAISTPLMIALIGLAAGLQP